MTNINGLTHRQLRKFEDFLVMANNEQLKAMFKQIDQHCRDRAL